MRLDGKVALITGAASGVRGELMGFGGAGAWLFAKEGAKVVVSDIDEERGDQTASQIREDGGEAIFVKLDTTREEDWTNAVQVTISSFGKLDVLVNNAGIGGRQTVEETTEGMWDAQMNVNAKGAFLGTKHAVPAMRKAGGGSIVNISSILGLVGSPSSAAYSASKGAIRLFTKATAIQYATDNIRANSVHPGYALTPMTEKSFSISDVGPLRLSRIPAGRFANADDIAYGLLYLASDESSFVTGSELVIDGGATAQ